MTLRALASFMILVAALAGCELLPELPRNEPSNFVLQTSRSTYAAEDTLSATLTNRSDSTWHYELFEDILQRRQDGEWTTVWEPTVSFDEDFPLAPGEQARVVYRPLPNHLEVGTFRLTLPIYYWETGDTSVVEQRIVSNTFRVR